MNICICPPRRDGSRKCRDPHVAQNGALFCGRGQALVATIRNAVTCEVSEIFDLDLPVLMRGLRDEAIEIRVGKRKAP